MQVTSGAAHGDKLRALTNNTNLPSSDRSRISMAIERYSAWIRELRNAQGEGEILLAQMVRLLNEYKRYIEVDLIFDSDENFLYRQKGQLKLDNTILEEFLPYIFDSRIVPGLARLPDLKCGPQSSFAGLSFASPFIPLASGGVQIKLKDQDFAVAKTHRILITDGINSDDTMHCSFVVSHFASEIKTNLDKTMFQEASQTAAELKRSVPGSKYILLCEFLDMTPITTKLTSIDEVIVLRKAKRLASNVRAAFSTAAGRRTARGEYLEYLDLNPLHISCFQRFIEHLNECFPEDEEDAEDVVLDRGYF